MTGFRNHCKAAGLERWEWKLLLLCSPNRFLITANIQCFCSTVSGLIIFSSFFPPINHLSTKQKQIKKMQIQQHHQSSQCLNIQALRHQQYCNNKKLFSSFERKKKCKLSKKNKKKNKKQKCKTGMQLQVLPLKTVKTEGFFLQLNMISDFWFTNASDSISVAES